MICHRCRSRLGAYLDGELSPGEHTAVEDHLVTCPACRERLGLLRGLAEMLRTALPAGPVPDDIAVTVLRRARQVERRGAAPEAPSRRVDGWSPIQWVRGLSWPMRAATCAAVVAALGIGLSLGRGREGDRLPGTAVRPDVCGLEWFGPNPPESVVSIHASLDGAAPHGGERE